MKPGCARPLDPVLHVVVQIAAHASQLAGGAEVAHQGEVGIGGRAGAVKQLLTGG